MSLIRANLWYSTPNVSSAKGNNVFTYSSATAAPTGTFTVTIADGLYSLSDLQLALNQAAYSNGHSASAGLDPVFVLGGIASTQLATISFPKAGFQWVATTATNAGLAQLLGFGTATVPPAANVPPAPSTAGQIVVAPLRADVSQGFASYAIHCDLATGSYLGGTAGDTLAVVPLSAPPNGLIIYNPPVAMPVGVSKSLVTSVTVYLTDQLGRRVSLNGEYYDVTLRIDEV